MPLSSHLTFIGYDEPAATVLLRGPFGATYRLAPTLGSAKINATELTEQDRNCRDDNHKRDTEGINVYGEEDDDDYYTESSCSASYVSSVSSCALLDNATEDPADAPSEEKHDARCESLSSQAINAPVHGTVLSLKPPHNLLFLTGDVPPDEVELYMAPIVMGYNEHDSVFLLPSPQLIAERRRESTPSLPSGDMYTYRCGSVLQLTVAAMLEHYSYAEQVPCPAPPLPLPADLMQCPLLDTTALRSVFNVEAEEVYNLSVWSSRVRFVGAAWGVPWVQVLSGNSPRTAGPLAIQPLALCHSGSSLRELYGLCRAEKEEDKEKENIEKRSGSQGVMDAQGFNCTSGLNTPGREMQSTSPPPRSPMPLRPFFIRGNTVVCRGPLGTMIECSVLPSVLASFCVSHGERLRGAESTAFSGREGIVLGVHLGCLVLLMDGERSATILRGVTDSAALLKLFVSLRNGAREETPTEECVMPVSNSLPEMTDGLNVESIAATELKQCADGALPPTPNKPKSESKETRDTKVSLNAHEGSISKVASGKDEDHHSAGNNSHDDDDHDDGTGDNNDDDHDHVDDDNDDNATARGVQMEKLHPSDDNAYGVQKMKNEASDPEEPISGAKAKRDFSALDVPSADGHACVRGEKNNQANGLEWKEGTADELADNAHGSVESGKKLDGRDPYFKTDLPDADPLVMKEQCQEEEEEEEGGTLPSSGSEDEGTKAQTDSVFSSACPYLLDRKIYRNPELTSLNAPQNNLTHNSRCELEESSRDAQISHVETVDSLVSQAQLQELGELHQARNCSVNKQPFTEDMHDVREERTEENGMKKHEEENEGSPSVAIGTNTNANTSSSSSSTHTKHTKNENNSNGNVKNSFISDEIGKKSASETGSGQTGPMDTPPFFTTFLKAFAYWRTGTYSVEAQRQQPLLFVNFYEIDTHHRVMDAIQMMQRYHHMLSAVSGKATSVERIVQILMEREGSPSSL